MPRTGARAPGAGAPLDLHGLVDRQVRAGKKAIAIPSGRHRVAPVRGQHLVLEDLEDVVLDAEGVELVCTQTTRALTVVDCRNVTVKGLVIDYDPLRYTKGRITQLSPDKQVHEIELFDGYPDADGVHAWKYEIFDPGTRLLRFGSYYDVTVERVGTRRLRVTKCAAYARQAKPEQAGDLVVIARAHAPAGSVPHAISAERCRDVTFDHVTVYASNCFGFFETACERSHYAHCAVDRRCPESDPVARASPRLRSLNADACHSKHATVGPEYVGCSAAFNGDDGVAINGDYHLVAGASGRDLRVIAKHSLDVRIGDAVEIVDPHGQRLADARAETIEPAGDITDAERELVKNLPMDEGLRTHRDGTLTRAFHVALEALDRRMRSVESEGLVVIDDPAGGWLGRYAIAKTSRQGRQRRHDRCPYETVLDGVRTLRGACSCPDFIKGALAGCKHMLAALAHVYANRARLDAACRQEAARTAPRHVHLAWNPVAPLCGTADHLARLRLDPMAAQSTAGRDAHDGRRAGYWRATGRLSGHNGIRNWTSYEVSP